MADSRGRSSSPSSEAYIEDLISSLHSAVDKTWKSALTSNKHTKKWFRSLLDLQAFQRSKFTDTEKYKQGRSALAFYGAKETQDVEAAHVRKFTDLMGFDLSTNKPKIYLSRELLAGKDTKAAFRRFRRRFGEVDHCLYASHPRLPAVAKTGIRRLNPLPSKRADTNMYVIRRMGRMMQSNSLSKGAVLLRSAREAVGNSRLKSLSPIPKRGSMSPTLPSNLIPSPRVSYAFMSAGNSPIRLVPTFLSLPSN